MADKIAYHDAFKATESFGGGGVKGSVFERAREMHRIGETVQAEALYKERLETSPDHGRCLYFLGLLFSQRGDMQQAAEYMSRGLEADPSSATGYNNLGTVFQSLGQYEKANACFIAALDVNPEQIEAHVNLGASHLSKGDFKAAEDCFRRALEIDPNFVDALVNLGAVLRHQSCYEEAEEVLRHAVECDQKNAFAFNNLGIILHERGHLQDAFMAFKRALEIKPEYADAYNNMGSVFRQQKQFDGALACYGKALELDETSADAHNNKGAVYLSLGDLENADMHFRRANILKPDFPPTLMNLGTVLRKGHQHQAAKVLYERALAIDPENFDAHFGLAELLLYAGDDLLRGWQEHQWRWKKPEFQAQWRSFDCAVWQGEPLQGKMIVVWGEQGIGEEILYATMVDDLIAQGAVVILECDSRLHPLFERSFPGVYCLARKERAELPNSFPVPDYQCAMGDLGTWVRPHINSFPDRTQLMQADQELRGILRKKYKALGTGPLIGVSWHSKNPEMGWEKSLALANLMPLFEDNRQATYIDLQYGDTLTERLKFEEATGIELLHDDAIDQMHDIDGFAAQVAALDLVISISNTTVHMAGGLGVPTWMMLSSTPLWRWFENRDDCPWYPSVRYFHQDQRGNWDAVVKQVDVALKKWLS